MEMRIMENYGNMNDNSGNQANRPDGMPPYSDEQPCGAPRYHYAPGSGQPSGQPPYQQWGMAPAAYRRETNGMGTAGFVLAVISLCGSWLPFVGGLTWLLGLIFSIIGVTRRPRGLAVAGLVISIVSLVAFILIAVILGLVIFASEDTSGAYEVLRRVV